MGARIIRQQLFDEAEKQEIHQTLLKMELNALRIIAEHPEKRDAVIARLNEAAEKFVRGEVRKKRIEGVVLSLILFAIGLVVVWVTGDEQGKIAMKIAGMLFISGAGTALINGLLWATDK